MASNKYQYGTSPRKIQEEPRRKPNKKPKKPKLKVVKEVPRQEVKVSQAQKQKQLKLTGLAILIFAILLAISYQNSQINVKFNEMQNQKNQLATLKKENEQLNINIENSLNIKNIEKEAKEKLGMEKLTNKQTVYINLPKKDYVEATTDKVIIEDEQNWLQKFINWILKK